MREGGGSGNSVGGKGEEGRPGWPTVDEPGGLEGGKG